MAVYAPDCEGDLDLFETFILNSTKILLEGRRAKEFFFIGDLNVELGLV